RSLFHLSDDRIAELVAHAAERLPELGVADAPDQRSSPEASAPPEIAHSFFHDLAEQRLIRLVRATPPPYRSALLDVTLDHRVEQLILALEARVDRSDRVA